jgi:predicted NBD/HSP70 family sugar kinase
MENIVVYIYFPDKYPPGVGVCINGKVYKGMNSFVGEVKYIPLGIDWKKLSADTQQNTCKAAAKLITTMICTINPQQIVLQGEFLLQGELSPEMALELVRTETARYLPETAMAELSVSTDFHKDFEQGIIRCTLELLSSKLCLVKE